MDWFISLFISFLLGVISFMAGTIPVGYGIARGWHKELPKVGIGDISANSVLRRLGWGWAIIVVLADTLKCMVACVIFFVFFYPRGCIFIKSDEYGNAVRDFDAPYYYSVWFLGTALLLFAVAVAGHAWHHWRKPRAPRPPVGG